MEQIGFLVGEHVLYWNDLIRTAASMGAVCLFLALYWGEGGRIFTGLVTAALSPWLCFFCARVLHWYCDSGLYSSFWDAVTTLSGGYSLLGCFVSCFLWAVFSGWMGLHHNLGRILDCMSLAGCCGIAVGRLSSFFDASGRGPILEKFSVFPFATAVINQVSGQEEYRLSTFFLQALFSGALFLALLVYYLRRHRQDGTVTRIFLLCYCASQVLLDSTRYDSLYFPFNRFVSVVQAASGVTMAAVLVLSGFDRVRQRGFFLRDVPVWLLLAGLMGCAGYMEYYIQRHGDQAAGAYVIMGLALASVCIVGSQMILQEKKTV